MSSLNHCLRFWKGVVVVGVSIFQSLEGPEGPWAFSGGSVGGWLPVPTPLGRFPPEHLQCTPGIPLGCRLLQP
jgi:hypothetical protein